MGSQCLDMYSYLSHFGGYEECGISSKKIYIPPITTNRSSSSSLNASFCKSRADLLYSLSNGRREKTDSPYIPLTCTYRWYTAAEICTILARFHAIIFLGDSAAANIYAGFNMLLREDLALGSLKQWEMDWVVDPQECMCARQFGRGECRGLRVQGSWEVDGVDADRGVENGEREKEHTHLHLPINITTTHPSSTPDPNPDPDSPHSLFLHYLHHSHSHSHSHTYKPHHPNPNPNQNQKPIPIIHALTYPSSPPSSLPASASTSALNTLTPFLTLSKRTTRPTPFLWIGPTAQGSHPRDTMRGRLGMDGGRASSDLYGGAGGDGDGDGDGDGEGGIYLSGIREYMGTMSRAVGGLGGGCVGDVEFDEDGGGVCGW
ncbi:hypothetical protein FQN53_000198 [Emmonsiellopsis sp. PD_33]|nr:hypothetical protein FQN53_000198 [Emmonsiellopsis sp. PD_33]